MTVRTGARLHFGLLDTVAPFGGVGLMIDQPATEIEIQDAPDFEVSVVRDDLPDDPADLRRRVQEVARRFADLGELPRMPAVSIRILRRPAAHSGLGTGTQLAMAIAAGLSQRFGHTYSRAQIIQDIAGRGARSGVGSHGFFTGGLVIDSEQPQAVKLPKTWRVVLLQPRQRPALISGNDESQRFAQLVGAAAAQRRELEKLLAEQLGPAARAANFAAFAAATGRYNRLSGSLFAATQGGPFNGPAITQLVDDLGGLGYQGTGQSSWGPTVFALCENQRDAESLASHPPQSASAAMVVQPLGAGALVTTKPS